MYSGGYNCLVGPNGSGKSSVLSALNVFFRESSSPTSTAILTEEDFHLRGTDDPIEITVTFVALSEAAQGDLSDYVRHGRLTIKARATWDPEKQTAEVKQLGSRLVMSDFVPYFEVLNSGALVADLRPIDGVPLTVEGGGSGESPC